MFEEVLSETRSMRLTRMLSKNAITICNHSKKLISKRLSFCPPAFYSHSSFFRDPNQLWLSRFNTPEAIPSQQKISSEADSSFFFSPPFRLFPGFLFFNNWLPVLNDCLSSCSKAKKLLIAIGSSYEYLWKGKNSWVESSSLFFILLHCSRI